MLPSPVPVTDSTAGFACGSTVGATVASRVSSASSPSVAIWDGPAFCTSTYTAPVDTPLGTTRRTIPSPASEAHVSPAVGTRPSAPRTSQASAPSPATVSTAPAAGTPSTRTSVSPRRATNVPPSAATAGFDTVTVFVEMNTLFPVFAPSSTPRSILASTPNLHSPSISTGIVNAPEYSLLVPGSIRPMFTCSPSKTSHPAPSASFTRSVHIPAAAASPTLAKRHDTPKVSPDCTIPPPPVSNRMSVGSTSTSDPALYRPLYSCTPMSGTAPSAPAVPVVASPFSVTREFPNASISGAPAPSPASMHALPSATWKSPPSASANFGSPQMFPLLPTREQVCVPNPAGLKKRQLNN